MPAFELGHTKPTMEFIVSHQGADFDALASMVCAHKLHPQARMVLSAPPQPEVGEFLTLHRSHFDIAGPGDVDPRAARRLILVDTRAPSRLGPFREVVQRDDIEVVIYDHHPATPESIRGDHEEVEEVGAAVTLLLEDIQERGLTLSEVEATLALIALYTDTGNLTFDSTTPRDARALAWLLEQGANLALARKFARTEMDEQQRQLLEELILHGRRLKTQGVTVMLAAATTGKFIPGLAQLTDELCRIEGVDCAVTAVRMGKNCHLVGRSKEPALNLVPLAEAFGGGGHPGAVSASLGSYEPEQALDKAAQMLQSLAPAEPTAADIMTREVECLSGEPSVTEAQQELRRLGHTAVCLVEDGKVRGMLSRSDLDKALAHDLGHAPASAYMTSKVHSVSPETPVSEIQALLVERDIGRVPVIQDGRLVGLVSRTDILSVLYRPNRPTPDDRQVSTRLLRLPRPALTYLQEAGSLAANDGLELYVVGGFVRDLLLGAPSLDLDLVVEGDAIAFGRRLGEQTGAANSRSHQSFGTSQLFYEVGPYLKVDLASSRTERYCRPAAKPVVSGSTLKQDLFRRDFSINCLAIRLHPEHFGELVDFFGGRRDLENGILRVLHNHSFIDDPTRILRGIRFEQRLNFRLETHTLHLLREAMRQQVFEHVLGERVVEEFRLCLAEAQPAAVLARLYQLKVWKALLAGVPWDHRCRDQMGRLPEVREHFPEVDPARVGLGVLAESARRAKVPREALRVPLDFEGLERARLALNTLRRQEMAAGELDRQLGAFAQQDLALVWALSEEEKVRERLQTYLEELSGVRSLVGGRHLIAWGYEPGPQFARILRGLREAQLNGELDTLEQARQYAHQHFSTCE